MPVPGDGPGILFLLPLFVIFVNLGQVTGINLYGSLTGLVITYMTFTLPFAIWMLAACLDTIPGNWTRPPRSMAPGRWVRSSG